MKDNFNYYYDEEKNIICCIVSRHPAVCRPLGRRQREAHHQACA